MKKIIVFIILSCVLTVIQAQQFDEYFQNRTLRIDYNFSGNSKQQFISVDGLDVIPNWYGKRQRLSEIPVEGNGQITVRDHKTGKIIYKNSFSTLFQEWLSFPEAEVTTKSFENVFLIPMPKDTVDITVDLRNNRRQIISTLTNHIVPTDILEFSISEKNLTPYVTLQKAADTTHCIHIAYLAEGYRQNEIANIH